MAAREPLEAGLPGEPIYGMTPVTRACLDTLPASAALFAAHEVPAKRLALIICADAQPWVNAEATLRPLFVACSPSCSPACARAWCMR